MAVRASWITGALRFAARALLVVSLVLLSQFLLGTVVNLFVAIPVSHPGAGVENYLGGAWRSLGWVFAHRWPFLVLHVIVGLGLLASSLTFLVRGLVTHTPARLLVWNILGAVGVTFAALSGIYFLIHPTVDLASLLMAAGFAVALGSVTTQLFLVGRAEVAASRSGTG